jgi:hypothetical protein
VFLVVDGALTIEDRERAGSRHLALLPHEAGYDLRLRACL